MDLENGRRNLLGWLLTCMIMDECGLGGSQSYEIRKEYRNGVYALVRKLPNKSICS